MKFSQFTVLSAVLLAFVLGHSIAGSEEEPGKPKPPVSPSEPPPGMPDMAKIQKLLTPGPQHKALGYFVGTWDVEISMNMHGPDGSAKVVGPTKATSVFSWKIDGRWLAEDMKGMMPMMGPVQFFFLFGYDNMTKNYVSVGVNSMDTSMLMFRGVKVDKRKEEKLFVSYGTLNEYLDGTFNKPVKTVVKKQGADNFTLEVWDLQIGEAGKPVIKMAYTRKK